MNQLVVRAHARENVMPRGDKAKYTDKQIRKADHIEEPMNRVAFRRMKRNEGRGRR